jgi:ribosome-associated translation inhibitor RaiA
MAHAGERTRKLEKYEPRLIAVDLLFDDDHGKLATEVRATVPGRPPAIARSAAADPRTSLYAALKKLGRQLRRERKKRVEHQAAPRVMVVED